MKLLITGSRQFTDYEALELAIETIEKERRASVKLILHGGAKGADTLAERYAETQSIPTTILRPDYAKHFAKVAPLKRNEELVRMADAVLALYGEQGKRGGTYFTAQKAKAANKYLCERFADGRLVHHEPDFVLLFK